MRPWTKAYWSLVWELTRTEFKLRDQGTLLGFFWTLLHPALMFAVLYAVFVRWLGRGVDFYGAYLLIGLVQWQFFEKATSVGFASLRQKALLIKNFNFAREITVIAGVGSVFLSYVLELAVLLLFLRASGIPLALPWLMLPLQVASLLILTLATALVLALMSVEFQDMERSWSVLTTAGFYLTPVFYPMSVISPAYRSYMELNPMLHVVAGFRACLLPRAESYGVPLVITAVFAVAGLAAVSIFQTRARLISDRIISP
jgi:ABC-type polysaccharide/polyol phosphate export permease